MESPEPPLQRNLRPQAGAAFWGAACVQQARELTGGSHSDSPSLAGMVVWYLMGKHTAGTSTLQHHEESCFLFLFFLNLSCP